MKRHTLQFLYPALFVVLILSARPAYAQSGTLIRATIAPVRIITINNRGEIIRIDSNTKQSVTPTAHLNSPDGPAVLVSEKVEAQYKLILSRTQLDHYGVVYRAPGTKSQGVAVSLLSFLSFLPWYLKA